MGPDAGINYDSSSEKELSDKESDENVLTGVFRPNDKLFFRPGFWDFIEYVKSKEGKIILGIWTFGNRVYADGLKPYLGDIFEFLYTAEDMKPGMLDKQLNYVVDRFDADMRRDLGIKRSSRRDKVLPKNIFLVDNRPQNINHDINRKNGIMVESFLGKSNADTMFENLETICESLLSSGRIPPQYIQNFRIEGKPRVIASIGTHFDDGVRPIVSKRSKSRSEGRSESRGTRSRTKSRRESRGGKNSAAKTRKKTK